MKYWSVKLGFPDDVNRMDIIHLMDKIFQICMDSKIVRYMEEKELKDFHEDKENKE